MEPARGRIPPGEAWAVVVAAGAGTRFGAPKQFAELAGRPVVEWSLAAAQATCTGVVLVVPVEAVGAHRHRADFVVAGGPTRSASVRAGLAAVPVGAAIIAVHDAARPLARVPLWRAGLEAIAAGADAAVPTVPVTDTVKETQPDGSLRTLDRARLLAVQTPQMFRAEVLRRAHAAGGEATDDAALVEAAGGRVVLIPGHPDNLKLTSPADLIVAAALLGGASS
jgi:2-C-methyl-D-erythritol 4-phosphate cytidylyltransferase